MNTSSEFMVITGNGCCFFSFSDTGKNNDCSSASRELKENRDWRDKAVLIVEDDPVNMLYLKKILKSTGINIFSVENGLDAIELSLSSKIDIILMDIRLPGINGFEATKKIKEVNPEIKVIAQTANVTEDDKTEAEKSGCDGFLYKPIDKDVLLKAMAEYLV